jgi:hypothetical protein
MNDNYREAIRVLLIELKKGESSAIELGWVTMEEVIQQLHLDQDLIRVQTHHAGILGNFR